MRLVDLVFPVYFPSQRIPCPLLTLFLLFLQSSFSRCTATFIGFDHITTVLFTTAVGFLHVVQ